MKATSPRYCIPGTKKFQLVVCWFVMFINWIGSIVHIDMQLLLGSKCSSAKIICVSACRKYSNCDNCLYVLCYRHLQHRARCLLPLLERQRLVVCVKATSAGDIDIIQKLCQSETIFAISFLLMCMFLLCKGLLAVAK